MNQGNSLTTIIVLVIVAIVGWVIFSHQFPYLAREVVDTLKAGWASFMDYVKLAMASRTSVPLPPPPPVETPSASVPESAPSPVNGSSPAPSVEVALPAKVSESAPTPPADGTAPVSSNGKVAPSSPVSTLPSAAVPVIVQPVPVQRPFQRLQVGAIGDMGVQVDAWGALVMDGARLAQNGKLLCDTLDVFAERELPNVVVSFAPIKMGTTTWQIQYEHVAIQQKLGAGGVATVVLHIAGRGRDLQLSWRLSENNPRKKALLGCSGAALIYSGVAVALVGIPMSAIGVGLALIPIGVAMAVGGFVWMRLPQRQTLANAFDQFDSRALAKTVDWCLTQGLAANGVSSQRVSVLWRNSMPGLGSLKDTELPNPISMPLNTDSLFQ